MPPPNRYNAVPVRKSRNDTRVRNNSAPSVPTTRRPIAATTAARPTRLGARGVPKNFVAAIHAKTAANGTTTRPCDASESVHQSMTSLPHRPIQNAGRDPQAQPHRPRGETLGRRAWGRRMLFVEARSSWAPLRRVSARRWLGYSSPRARLNWRPANLSGAFSGPALCLERVAFGVQLHHHVLVARGTDAMAESGI